MFLSLIISLSLCVRVCMCTVCIALITAKVLYARYRDSFFSVDVCDAYALPYKRQLLASQDDGIENTVSNARRTQDLNFYTTLASHH